MEKEIDAIDLLLELANADVSDGVAEADYSNQNSINSFPPPGLINHVLNAQTASVEFEVGASSFVPVSATASLPTVYPAEEIEKAIDVNLNLLMGDIDNLLGPAS